MKTSLQGWAAFVLILFPSVKAAGQTDFWQQTNGPFGFGSYVIGFDSSGYVFAANDNINSDGGIYRSSDNGNTWQHIGLLHEYVLAFVTDQNGYVFAGTSGAGIFKSIDHGSSWTQMNNGLTDLSIDAMTLRLQDELFAGTRNSGVFYSPDDGLQWFQRSAGLPDSRIGSLAANSAGTLFATTDSSGVFKSTNAGLTWIPSSSGLTSRWTNVVVVDPHDVLYLGTQGGVYRSTDDGDSWVQMNSGLSSTLVWALAANQAGYVFCGLLNAEVYRSTNQGEHWELAGDFGIGESMFLAVSSLGHIFFANYYGVFRSTDSGTLWTQCGLPNSRVLAVTTHPNGRVFASPDRDVPYYTTDGGTSWVRSSAPGYAVTSFVRNSRDMVFAGSDYLDKSTDGGATWTRVGTGLPIVPIRALISDYRDWLYAGLDAVISPPGYYGGGLYRSTDDGALWSPLGFDEMTVNSIAVTTHGHIFAFVGYPYRSTDDGQSWEILFQLTSATQTLLSVEGDTLLAGTVAQGILRSTDDGDTWLEVLPDVTIHSFAYHTEGKVLAAADTDGVYLSTDKGASWVSIGSGLEGREVNCLTFDDDGFAFAGTIGGGIFASTQRITSVNEENRAIPASSALSQNYPNPFNTATTIEFVIRQSSFVNLSIYDLLGREVATLVNEKLGPGRYERAFNARSLASGVYFYRLREGEFVETRKLVVLR